MLTRLIRINSSFSHVYNAAPFRNQMKSYLQIILKKTLTGSKLVLIVVYNEGSGLSNKVI